MLPLPNHVDKTKYHHIHTVISLSSLLTLSNAWSKLCYHRSKARHSKWSDSVCDGVFLRTCRATFYAQRLLTDIS